MQTELEATFLNINPNTIRHQLAQLGATLVHEERLMRRNVYDYPDRRLQKAGGWIRVRDEGDQVTLSYKHLQDRTITGTKELCVTVSDFDTTSALFEAIGMQRKSYQETRRERWQLNNIEITLDTWPWIPTFLELEGPDESKLKDIAQRLELDWQDALFGSVENVYQTYYTLTEEEIRSWPEITFSSVPDWLAAKQK